MKTTIGKMKQSADLPPLRIPHDDKSTPLRFRFTKSISPISFLLLLTFVPAMMNLLLLPSSSLNIETTTGMQVKNNTSSSSSGQCMDLSANQNMESLIQSASQVFVTMPAKAGGTTMKEFTAKCMNNTVEDNILSREDLWKEFLIGSLHVQPFISSHMYTEANFQYLVKSTSRDTLIIHTHREESSRVISAVKEIVGRVCGPDNTSWHRLHEEALQKLNVRKNATHCTFDEEGFVDLIGSKICEVGFSTHRLLTCRTYNHIEKSAPQLVFLNYKQIDKLNILLAKRFCPEMLPKLPIQSNVAADKKPIKVFLDKEGGNVNDVVVGLDEWLKAKGPALEWTLKLRDKASCQRKTRRMEDELFGCRDEALRVTPESVGRW